MQPLRGMKDIVDGDAKRFTRIIQTASDVAKRFGFDFIETPILESTGLFLRSVGESSDIVNKEMYRFEDKGGNDVCMRPEGTAGVVRAFITQKLDKQDAKRRWFYYGPMFRYERPQKGRLRQFHQFGIESFGIADVLEDFFVIALANEILQALNIDATLKLNSLGCDACMPPYKQTLVRFLQAHQEALCSDCRKRIQTNPIRTLDCKNASCQAILQDAPKITDVLCERCESDFVELKTLLDEAKILYEVDSALVRGLDYYNKTTFEFVSNELGAQSAVAGGGRYDKLVEHLGGKATPAVGFALGIERLMELAKIPAGQRSGIYMGALSDEALARLIPLALELRKAHKVTLEYAPKSFKSHMKGANRANARFALLLGENELKEGKVWLKDIETNKEKTIDFEELNAYLNEHR